MQIVIKNLIKWPKRLYLQIVKRRIVCDDLQVM